MSDVSHDERPDRSGSATREPSPQAGVPSSRQGLMEGMMAACGCRSMMSSMIERMSRGCCLEETNSTRRPAA